MAIWLTALKIIPWTEVIKHAPTVIKGARQFLDRQSSPPAPPPSYTGSSGEPGSLEHQLETLYQQHANDVTRLDQALADLTQQHAQLTEDMQALRSRTRWLIFAMAALWVLTLAWAAWGN